MKRLTSPLMAPNSYLVRYGENTAGESPFQCRNRFVQRGLALVSASGV